MIKIYFRTGCLFRCLGPCGQRKTPEPHANHLALRHQTPVEFGADLLESANEARCSTHQLKRDGTSTLASHCLQELVANRKLSGRLEAAEAAAALLKEEVVETRQAVSWREEELGKMRKANAELEV